MKKILIVEGNLREENQSFSEAGTLESKTVDLPDIPTMMSALIHLLIQNSTQALPASAKCMFSL